MSKPCCELCTGAARSRCVANSCLSSTILLVYSNSYDMEGKMLRYAHNMLRDNGFLFLAVCINIVIHS